MRPPILRKIDDADVESFAGLSYGAGPGKDDEACAFWVVHSAEESLVAQIGRAVEIVLSENVWAKDDFERGFVRQTRQGTAPKDVPGLGFIEELSLYGKPAVDYCEPTVVQSDAQTVLIPQVAADHERATGQDLPSEGIE